MQEIKDKSEFLNLFQQTKKKYPKAFISYTEREHITQSAEYIHKIISCPYMGKDAEEQPETIAIYKASKAGLLQH